MSSLPAYANQAYKYLTCIATIIIKIVNTASAMLQMMERHVI